jgi:Formyl transferase
VTGAISPDVLARYPVRARTDGDFSLVEMLGRVGVAGPSVRGPAVPLAGVAEAAARVRLWQLADLDADAAASVTVPGQVARALVAGGRVRDVDVALLHCFEASALFRPMVAERTSALTRIGGRPWLTLAAHWLGVSAATGDLRFFNAACKLLGAVWIQHCDTIAPVGAVGQIAMVARMLESASADLTSRLANRLLPLGHDRRQIIEVARPGPRAALGRRTTVAVAGAGSGSPARFAAIVAEADIALAELCWYGRPASGRASGYASAWYPPDGKADAAAVAEAPSLRLPQTWTNTWGGVADVLRRREADLVVLLGMPIVPVDVLKLARVGVINAHNGALPTYRGMDAVAWAVLNNDPVTCTLHLAVPGVDTGPVLATVAVPLCPTGTLKTRVKTTQLRLLASAAAHVAAWGTLPDATAQPTTLARQFYRLHPHLKRMMDASPYGVAPDRGGTGGHP